MLRKVAIPLFLILGLTPVGLAHAQISPGPLSSAHASLEGNTNCMHCHGLKQESIQEHCLQCHQGIAILRENGKGFHARTGKQECEKCHPEHAGVDFQLVDWPDGSAAKFRHERTGWRLEGAHAKLKCDKCHNPKFQKGPGAAREPGGSIHQGKGWLGLTTDCTHCHADPHKGKLGADCQHCHGMQAWRPVANFDHSRTDYPLDGKHAALKCAQCHENQRLGAKLDSKGKVIPLYRPLAHRNCQPCHADPHQGRFKGNCRSCHTTAGFKLAASTGFNHALTSFPLRGKHATLRCESCHDPKKAWGKRPAHDRCDRCHHDPHGGQLVGAKGVRPDCSSCHTESNWRQSTFDQERHAKTSFALTGAHARVDCGKCHRTKQGVQPDPAWGKAHVRFKMESKRCLDCHAAAHGQEIDATRDCSKCHTTEAWRPSRIDGKAHAASGWPLEGAHAKAKCEACHGAPGEQKTTAAAKAHQKGTDWRFASLGRSCDDCHIDPHQQRYAKSADWSPKNPCRRCHDMSSFVPSTVSVEEHAALGYKLEGAHRAVPCFECHKALQEPSASSTLLSAHAKPRTLVFRDKRRACRDCHTLNKLKSLGDRP